MENWIYQVQSNPRQVIDKLESALDSAEGFIFDVDKESTSFKIRKPVKYPDQILHRNRIIVNGKMINTNKKNETDIEIAFAQDFYMKMTVFSIVVFGGILIALTYRASSGALMYILGILVFGVGVVLWKALQNKLVSDAQKYKIFVTDILGA